MWNIAFYHRISHKKKQLFLKTDRKLISHKTKQKRQNPKNLETWTHHLLNVDPPDVVAQRSGHPKVSKRCLKDGRVVLSDEVFRESFFVIRAFVSITWFIMPSADDAWILICDRFHAILHWSESKPPYLFHSRTFHSLNGHKCLSLRNFYVQHLFLFRGK